MQRSKSGLFLMELIIAICFFAVASAVCVQLFAISHTLSRRSSGMQMAVQLAAGTAEGFKILGDDVNALAELMGGTTFYGDDGNVLGFVAWFDEDWHLVETFMVDETLLYDRDGSRYELTAEFEFGRISTVNISVTDALRDELLHTLSSSRYMGVRR